MTRTGFALTTAAFALCVGAAQAQTESDGDSNASAPDPSVMQLSTGEVIDGQAADESYVASTHDDWEIVCMPVADGEDTCQMYQLLRDGEGNATAEITIFPLPAGQQAAAGATVLTPLETLLTAQLVMQVDDGPAKRYPFTFCSAIGCVARVGFTAEEIDAFRGGATATWELAPVAAPDQRVALDMSLIGFTAAFAELSADG